jgi:hypothetical protein
VRIQVRFGKCTLNGNNGLGRIDGEFSSESLNCPGRSDETAAILAASMEHTSGDRGLGNICSSRVALPDLALSLESWLATIMGMA